MAERIVGNGSLIRSEHEIREPQLRSGAQQETQDALPDYQCAKGVEVRIRRIIIEYDLVQRTRPWGLSENLRVLPKEEPKGILGETLGFSGYLKVIPPKKKD